MSKYHKFTPHFTYYENRDDITQCVEIELSETSKQLHDKINCIDPEQKVFRFEGERKLIYATEVLIPDPEVRKGQINLLMLLGNPAGNPFHPTNI